MTWNAYPVCAGVLALFVASPVFGDGSADRRVHDGRAGTVDTEIGRGITTTVADVFGDGSNVPVVTSIASVTYGKRKHVRKNGLDYFELSGSVQGSGWGGEADLLTGPGPTFDAESRYDYDVPFVLRWPAAFDGTLVYYAHGYPNLGLSLFADSMIGASNEIRTIDKAESMLVAVGALAPTRGHAVFSPNLSGMRRDGSPSAVALEGPFADQPLNLSIDVPITRDLAQVAKRLAAQMAGRSVDRTIGVGHSGGALVLQYVVSGATTTVFDGPHAGARVFTGGNFVTAYDPTSGLVFDGAIPIAPSDVLEHEAYPITAPMILLGGSADFAVFNMVRFASRIVRRGVDPNEVMRLYEIGNLPHNFAEIVDATPTFNQFQREVLGEGPVGDSERLAPVVAASLDAMRAWIAEGTPPPISRVAGRGLDTDADTVVDTIEFDLANGATTSLLPHGVDPAIDMIVGDQIELSVAGGFSSTVSRFVDTLGALEHDSVPLVLPYSTCRLGGFEHGLLGDAKLLPFSDFRTRYRNVKAYRAAVNDAIASLAATGTYDRTLGEKVIITPRIKALYARGVVASRSDTPARCERWPSLATVRRLADT